jgi:hypothetical protein
MILGKGDCRERAKDAEVRRATSRSTGHRPYLIAANKLDTEDPEPLYEFYRTFLSEGSADRNALAALHYASDLAPQDLNKADFGHRLSQ